MPERANTDVAAYGGRFAEDVLPFLEPGRALISLVGIEGSTPRPLGAQMVVAPANPARGESDGASPLSVGPWGGEGVWGYLTGGCVEEAIVTEARQALAEGTNRRQRYGAGSPYRDLVLPCGSAVELFFDVGVDPATVTALKAARDERRAVATRTDFAALRSARLVADPAGEGISASSCENGQLLRLHTPPLRLVMAGAGPVCLFLGRFAREAGMEVSLLTPDAVTADLAHGMTVRRLTSPREPLDLGADPWTAIAVLFHDHDWEPVVLQAALASTACYIGAMGSARTHAARLATLEALGVASQEAARIKGPAGVTSGARSAPEIALSILTEIQYEARQGAQM